MREEAIADLESRLRLAEEENKEIKKQCRDVTLGVRVPATGNVEAKMWRMQKEHEEEADKWAREKRYMEQQHAHTLALHKQEAHEHGLAMQEVRKLQHEADTKDDTISEQFAQIRNLEHAQRLLEMELLSARKNVIYGTQFHSE